MSRRLVSPARFGGFHLFPSPFERHVSAPRLSVSIKLPRFWTGRSLEDVSGPLPAGGGTWDQLGLNSWSWSKPFSNPAPRPQGAPEGPRWLEEADFPPLGTLQPAPSFLDLYLFAAAATPAESRSMPKPPIKRRESRSFHASPPPPVR